MIPKGNARGGGQQLATHLLNSYDNDRVEIVELRGAIASDLHGAFAEWHAQSKATSCRKYLYSLSVNPDHRQGPFTREKYYDFISRTERRLKLTDQPRAVVFHVKAGREHCHVVWSRIDTGRMKAVQLSHDRQKLRFVAREYARDHGITLPEGMRNNRGRLRFNFNARCANLGENQQKERTGISKEEHVRLITEAWAKSKDAPSFVSALEERGYYLARGDSGRHVVVDLGGEIHGLYRQVEKVTGKQVRQRLGESYAVEKLKDLHTVLEHAKKQRTERLKQSSAQNTPENEKTPDERRRALEKEQSVRRLPLEKQKQEMNARHRSEQQGLADLQRAETQGVIDTRVRNQPKGVIAFLTRITGIKMIVENRQRRADKDRETAHDAQGSALLRRHGAERQEIDRRGRALDALDKRERRSLETGLHREEFRRVVAFSARQLAAQPGAVKALTPIELAKEFQRRAQRPVIATEKANTLSQAFDRAVKAVNRLNAEKATGKPAPEEKPGIRGEFRKAVDPATAGSHPSKTTESKAPVSNAKTLAEEFRRRAEQKAREQEPETKPKPKAPGQDREQ